MNQLTRISGEKKLNQKNSSQLSPTEVAMAYETRLWIAVVATLLLSEVWMHLLGHQVVSLWGLIPAAILFGVSGLPRIRFHDLRHTAASLMLNYGIPVLIVSQRLGHSRASIAMDVYGHLIPSQQEHAVQLMDEIMTPIPLPVAHGLHTKE